MSPPEAASAKPSAGGLLGRFGPELAQSTVVLMWASTYIVTKDAFKSIDPLPFVFVRFILMIVLAWGVMLLTERGKGRPLTISRAHWPVLLVSALTGYTGYQLGFMFGLDNSSPFVTSLLIALVPFFTMIALAIRGEQTPPYGWIGLALAVAGVILFLSDKERGGTLAGVLWCLLAAVSFAIYQLSNRTLTVNYPPAVYTAWTLLVGTIPLALVSFKPAIETDWTGLSIRTWGAIAFMVIFPVYVAYMLWNYAIAKRGPAKASSFGLMTPVLSGVLSAVFFAEAFGPYKLIGGACAIGGLVVMRLKRRGAKGAAGTRKPGPSPQSSPLPGRPE